MEWNEVKLNQFVVVNENRGILDLAFPPNTIAKVIKIPEYDNDTMHVCTPTVTIRSIYSTECEPTSLSF